MITLNEKEAKALNDFISEYARKWLLCAENYLTEREIELLEDKLSQQ